MVFRTGAIVAGMLAGFIDQAALAVGLLQLSPPPVGAGASAPQLAAGRDGAWLSWLEADGSGGKRLRVARWNPAGWSVPSTVVHGPELLANWADVPGVVESSEGALYAQWLVSYHGGYGIELARSSDSGKTWTRLGPLHADRSASEHGFVSFAPAGSGLLAFWLDGRSTVKGGATELRMRRLDNEAAGPPVETVLDERVCDCCQTAAVASGAGAWVAFRDRSASEIRDISVLRIADGKASTPTIVHRDAWKIMGCPVNGPAIAVAGQTVVVAWFTGASDKPRVEAARSTDGGVTFGSPVLIDDAAPLGRVSVALGPDGEAAVSWLGRAPQGDGAELRVQKLDAAGRKGAPLRVADLAGGRAGGTPRMVGSGDRLVFAWVEKGSIAGGTLGWTDLPR
ncbi:MAG: hypothetical protein ABI609_10720 [Acidobacteriota bacterium]